MLRVSGGGGRKGISSVSASISADMGVTSSMT